MRTRQATTGAGHKWRGCLRPDLLLYALIESPLATSTRSSLPPQLPLALLRLTSVPSPTMPSIPRLTVPARRFLQPRQHPLLLETAHRCCSFHQRSVDIPTCGFSHTLHGTALFTHREGRCAKRYRLDTSERASVNIPPWVGARHGITLASKVELQAPQMSHTDIHSQVKRWRPLEATSDSNLNRI